MDSWSVLTNILTTPMQLLSGFFSWTWLIVLIVISVPSLYLYLTWTFDHWKRLNIPGAKPVPLFGTALPAFRLGFTPCLVGYFDEYGPVFGGFTGRQPVLFVADPELTKRICVKEFENFTDRLAPNNAMAVGVMEKSILSICGEDWRRVRNIISPSFTGAKLRQMIGFIERSATVMTRHLEKATDPDNVHVDDVTGCFAMDVVAGVAFGLELDSKYDPKNPFIEHIKKVTQTNFRNPLVILSLLFPKLVLLLAKFRIVSILPKKSVDFFTGIVTRAVETRDNNNTDCRDFLRLMMDARADDKTDSTSSTQTNTKTLSEEELMAQALTFFAAGYETTSSTLSFAFYLLALNPETQEKLYQEISNLSAEKMSLEVVSKLSYLEAVINETMRIYPQGLVLSRVNKNAFKLDDERVIPAGTPIVIGVHYMQNNADIWPDPDRFIPDRFIDDDSQNNCFLPFGLGPRNCIGMRLAMLTMKLAIISVCRHYRMCPGLKTEVPLKVMKNKMKAENGVFLRFEKR